MLQLLYRPTEVVGLIVIIVIGGIAGIVFYYAIEEVGQDFSL